MDGVPYDSRIARDLSLHADPLTEQTAAKVAGLREIAARRGQSHAAMALAWTLRDPRMTSTLVGASSVEQLEQNVRSLDRLDFEDGELAEIDRFATDSEITLSVERRVSQTGQPSGRPSSRSRRRFGSAKRAVSA